MGDQGLRPTSPETASSVKFNVAAGLSVRASPRIAALRPGMRAHLQASALLDAAGFMAAFEALLEKLAAAGAE